MLGVLIARVTGRTLGEFMRERIFEPLGMRDTGYHVSSDKVDRIPVSYTADPETGALVRRPDPRDGAWDRPPAFPSGGGGPGLVSTADDYLAFCRMLLNKGRYEGGRILSRPAVEVMTTDHLTPEQKAGNELFLGLGGWGSASRSRAAETTSAPGPAGSAGPAAWAPRRTPIRPRS